MWRWEEAWSRKFQVFSFKARRGWKVNGKWKKEKSGLFMMFELSAEYLSITLNLSLRIFSVRFSFQTFYLCTLTLKEDEDEDENDDDYENGILWSQDFFFHISNNEFSSRSPLLRLRRWLKMWKSNEWEKSHSSTYDDVNLMTANSSCQTITLDSFTENFVAPFFICSAR